MMNKIQLICTIFENVTGWAIFYCLSDFSKSVVTNFSPKLPTFWGYFDELSKCFSFLWKGFWGNFLQTLGDFELKVSSHSGLAIL